MWNLKATIFLCPSDTNAGKDHLNSYHGSFGTGTAPWATSTNGFFVPRFTAYGIQDLTDGSSSTIAFTEALTGDFNRLQSRHRSMVSGVPGGSLPANFLMYDARTNMAIINQNALNCWNRIKTTPGTNSNRGYRWQTGSPGLTLMNIILTPNSNQWQFSACRWDCGSGCGTDFGHLFTPSSSHPGGVNVLFGDGSVRFVKDSISQIVWMNLGSRDGGELISSDSY